MPELANARASNAAAKDRDKQMAKRFDSAKEAIGGLKHALASSKRLKVASVAADREKAKQANVLNENEAAKAKTTGIQHLEEKRRK